MSSLGVGSVAPAHRDAATELRVGSVAAPAAWAPRIDRAIRATTWNTPGVMTAIPLGWLEDRTAAQIEVHKRRDAEMRQAIVVEALHGLRMQRHTSSYFVWVPLPEHVRADRTAMALTKRRDSVSTAEPFAAGAQMPHA